MFFIYTLSYVCCPYTITLSIFVSILSQLPIFCPHIMTVSFVACALLLVTWVFIFNSTISDFLSLFIFWPLLVFTLTNIPVTGSHLNIYSNSNIFQIHKVWSYKMHYIMNHLSVQMCIDPFFSPNKISLLCILKSNHKRNSIFIFYLWPHNKRIRFLSFSLSMAFMTTRSYCWYSGISSAMKQIDKQKKNIIWYPWYIHMNTSFEHFYVCWGQNEEVGEAKGENLQNTLSKQNIFNTIKGLW